MSCQDASDGQKKGLKCEELVIDIPSDLEPAEWPECCIYRVPKKLRKVNRDAYTPKLISIGPLHHLRQECRDMEKQKLRYLKAFCDRTGKSQEDLARIIEKKEVNIRHCYADSSKLSRKEFIKMVMLDGIFIIELFWRNSDEKECEKDYILSKPWLRDAIQHDLLLLENQLPYFILEDLYMSVRHGSSSCNDHHHTEGQQMKKPKEVHKDTPFLKLCRNYFYKYDQQPKTDMVIGKAIKHFTDLLRYFFYPLELEEKEKKAIDRLCSATKLDEAGVKFKQVKERHLLDIQFQKGNVTPS
jgi:hypothetical protein